MRMRRWVLGAVIALGIALGIMAASYVAVGHFYGATQREVYMQVENEMARVTTVSWEEAETSNAPILTYSENVMEAGAPIVDWKQTGWYGGVCVQNFDNAVLQNSQVLSPVSEADPFTWGKIYLADNAYGSRLYRYASTTASAPAAPSYGDTEAPEAPTITGWSANLENGAKGSFIVSETTPPDPLPIAASLGIAAGIIVFAAWIGYRRAWGDATSTLIDHGLHDMTVRDIEIVGYIMERGKFTIPELMKQTKASKITVWRTVQKLVEQGLVRPTEETKQAANGLGGRGKPSRIYKYTGKPESE